MGATLTALAASPACPGACCTCSVALSLPLAGFSLQAVVAISATAAIRMNNFFIVFDCLILQFIVRLVGFVCFVRECPFFYST
jgi:hypothetical protein